MVNANSDSSSGRKVYSDPTYAELPAGHTQELINLILDDFSRQHGMPVGIYQTDGGPALFSKKAKDHFSPLCRYMDKNKAFKGRCQVDHDDRGQKTSEPDVRLCHCGLMNFGMPIVLDGVKFATVLCGQRRPSDLKLADESKERLEGFMSACAVDMRIAQTIRKRYEKVEPISKKEMVAIGKDLEGHSKLVLAVYFEQKRLNKQRYELMRWNEQVAHEVLIFNQGALAESQELVRALEKEEYREAKPIARGLEGRMLHLSTAATNMLWETAPQPAHISEKSILGALDECIKTYRWFATGRDIKIRLEIGPGTPIIRHSRQHMATVFRNLLHNAIKYSFKGNEAQDRFRHVVIKARGKGHYYEVSFENFGIGILESEFEKILELRERGSLAVDERRSGTGLGLMQVKAIIDMHGGEVRVRSHKMSKHDAYVNKFTIMLPYYGETDE